MYKLVNINSGYQEYHKTYASAEKERATLFEQFEGDYDEDENLIPKDYDVFCDAWVIEV